jgi:LuxR family transcriptional regulator, quorum-sensing system regulator BjaR1
MAMADLKKAFDFMEFLDSFKTVEELQAGFQELISEFGFTCFNTSDITSPRLRRSDRVMANTYPDQWAEALVENEYIAVDPVIHQLFKQNTPFRWRELRQQATGVGAKVMDAARDFRLNDGLSVSTHAATGEMLGLSMAGEKIEMSRRDELTLHMAAIYFEERLQKLLGQKRPTHRPLTDREKDCLGWVATGKTDWEMSLILGISAETAKTYVKNAMQKLNATNRAQAVALAITYREITP